jgi:hypothetical protein
MPHWRKPRHEPITRAEIAQHDVRHRGPVQFGQAGMPAAVALLRVHAGALLLAALAYSYARIRTLSHVTVEVRRAA